jgi:hypothetical protein
VCLETQVGFALMNTDGREQQFPCLGRVKRHGGCANQCLLYKYCGIRAWAQGSSMSEQNGSTSSQALQCRGAGSARHSEAGISAGHS